ncbi:response regulator transcription factor [Pyxidicoccus parkwayensis]|uniref:Response regulator transcription factor n=1 Tax=Pyxidicoccus parkwayensis TaxID=2813578 RepID=A0ABX7NTX2_9BACT|nr:LuxR C-terminal-related transcriptional regulator [Pyxidicoccus parkwaysis]QSQ20836.1 response regulator transcription factor [Pyxidicoccus parkwaysis]
MDTDIRVTERAAATPLLAGCSTGPRDRLFDIALAYARRKRLSSRECEVFTRFVSQGKTSKEIAAELGIAYPTVKLYWTRIYRKLECDDAVGALVAFMREVTMLLPAAASPS